MDNPILFPSDPYKVSNGLDVLLGVGSSDFGVSTGMTLFIGEEPKLGGVLEHIFTIDAIPE